MDLPLAQLPSSRAQNSSRSSKPKGGLNSMRRNAQLSERGKVRTKALVQDEEAEMKLANQEEAAQRAAEAAEAFANRSRAVTFLPASMDATLDLPAGEAALEEEAAKEGIGAKNFQAIVLDVTNPEHWGSALETTTRTLDETGRPFTGDYAGVLLYRTLHRFGFASAAESVAADDGLRLDGCRIVNAVKCVPPQNKPIGKEIANCNNYLRHELDAQPDQSVVLALGRIAHQAVLRALGLRAAHYAFAHGARHELSQGRVLFDSYHCSRYNVQTRRLTEAMFINVFEALLPDVRRAA